MTAPAIPADIHELLDRHGGVLVRSALEAAGVSMRRVYRLVHSGVLTTIFPGCYAPTQNLAALSDWERFALNGRAFAQQHRAYLTGWAATAIRDLPTLGRPPARPTAVRPRRGGRAGSSSFDYGRLLVARVPPEHLRRRGSLPITSVAWSVADIARTTRLPHALVVADAVAPQGTDVAGSVAHMARWAGAARARWVIGHMDPAIETPLETLGRFGFLEFDFPLPVVNAWVGHGGPEYRVDGLLPWHWFVYEGDGARKYSGPDSPRVIRKQNDREFRLRRLGLDFVRYDWSDVYPSREPFITKVRAMFSDHPRRDEPVKWWKNVPGVGAVEPSREDWPSPYPARIILPAGWHTDLAT